MLSMEYYRKYSCSMILDLELVINVIQRDKLIKLDLCDLILSRANFLLKLFSPS